MSWSALLIGPALVALLFACWLAVQTLWRRAFNLPARADVLADRCSCSSCPRPDTCSSRSLTCEQTEDDHGR